ncbi:MAG TPA: VWA domain-containing protein [Bacillota bacterium]
MRFFAPLGFLFLLGAPPIILLYILKLRRKDVPVSSTFLWRQLVRDFQANAPWQRLRKNLLLLLQLLIVLLLALALARPYLVAPRQGTGDTVVLLDVSASMEAAEGGSTRLAKAQEKIGGLVSGMGPRDTMTIVAVGPLPRVLLPSTHDARALRTALAGARTVNGPADLGKALSLAESMAKGRAGLRVIIVGDGGYRDLPSDFALTLPVVYLPVGTQAENLAVTGLSVRPMGPRAVAMTRVINFGSESATTVLTLAIDGAIFDAREVELKAGEEKDVFWEDLPAKARLLQARLSTGGALKGDDEVFAVAAGESSARVLMVTKGNRFLEQALSLYPGVELFKCAPEAYKAGDYDLYVFDGFLPPSLPKANLISLDPPVGNWPAEVGSEAPAGFPQAARPEEQLLSYVDLRQVHVAKAKKLTLPTWARTVIDASTGPLLIAGEEAGRRAAVFAFDLHQSDLPLRTGFPILIQNLMAWELPVGAGAALPEAGDDRLRVEALPQAEEVSVTDPSQKVTRVAPPFPPAPLDQVGRRGFYEITQKWGSNEVVAHVAVNFPVATESTLAVPDRLSLGRRALGGAAKAQAENREVWPVAAILALGVLTVEWWVYHRGS